jgi:hypothetical protein
LRFDARAFVTRTVPARYIYIPPFTATT